MSKKQISLITAILLVISSTVIGFGEKRDIHNHWAEEFINYMVEKNVVNGYPDGTFKPENKMTKAEFYSVINGLIGYDEKTAISFNDVKESNWFYEHVQKGVSANYIPKTSNLNPNANITREEVARILSIVFEVEENHEEFKKFTDYNSINMELRGIVGGLAKNGYLAGYPDGTIRPQGEIKRSEVVAMLSNITGEIINSPGTNSIRDIKRNVLINTENSVLKDSIIEGNLYITEGVKDGDITLDNVEVKGNLVVKGGGENSVIIKNSKINRILVKKPRGIVRLVLESTNVNTMNASKEAKIELLNNTSVKDINIEDKIELYLEKGSIISILNIKGNESILEVLGNIEKINGEEEIAINGERIKLSEINEIKEGNVVDNKATETLTQGGSPSSGGSGGGGGSGGSLPVNTPSEVIINSITIKGINNAGVIAKDTSVQLYTDILPLNATNKGLRWSVDNSSVLHISDNGYIYAAGKGIATVTATARDGSGVTGSLTITVTEGKEDSPRVNIGQTITKNGVSVTIEKLEYHEDGFIPDGSSYIYNKGFSVYYRIENNSSKTYTQLPPVNFKLEPSIYMNEVNRLGYSWIFTDGNNSDYIYPGEIREYFTVYRFQRDIEISEIELFMDMPPNIAFGTWVIGANEETVPITDITIRGINDGATIEKGTSVQLYADILPSNATNKNLIWAVNDNSVARVSENGNVYATEMGTFILTATARDGSGVTGSLTITVTEANEDSPRVNIGQTITKDGVSVTIEKLEYHEDGFIPDGSSYIYNKGFSVYYRIENNSSKTYQLPPVSFKVEPSIYMDEVNRLGYSWIFTDGNNSDYIYPGEVREYFTIYTFEIDIEINEIEIFMDMPPNRAFGIWGL